MKYYLYISDAKVDMLLPQIPDQVRKKIATEFKIDLKIISASRRAETDNSHNRISRLETVCQFLQEYSDVGDVDNPGEYIFDTLDMKYQLLPDISFRKEENGPSTVYFSGYTDHTVVGLGGSLQHMIGQVNATNWFGGSDLYSILESLKNRIANEEMSAPDSEPSDAKNRLNDGLLEAVRRISMFMEGPKQRIEFLARRLIHRSGFASGQSVSSTPEFNCDNMLLATPLYVALADLPRGIVT